MSYVDPDSLIGAMTSLGTAIDDHAEAITANGGTPATLKTRLKTIQDDLGSKKSIRDKKKEELATAQTVFGNAATQHYAGFSDLVDSIAGILGKKTPAGARVLECRKHLNASSTHQAQPAPKPATPSA